MTPLLAFLLFLLAVTVWWGLYEWRQTRVENELWKLRRRRLSHETSDDLCTFEFKPGAMWLVDVDGGLPFYFEQAP